MTKDVPFPAVPPSSAHEADQRHKDPRFRRLATPLPDPRGDRLARKIAAVDATPPRPMDRLARIPARIEVSEEVTQDGVKRWELVLAGTSTRWILPIEMPEGAKAGDVIYVDLLRPFGFAGANVTPAPAPSPSSQSATTSSLAASSTSVPNVERSRDGTDA